MQPLPRGGGASEAGARAGEGPTGPVRIMSLLKPTSLAEMVGNFNAAHRILPVIRTSRYMPRGKTFEYDEPNLLGEVTMMRADGSIVREARRVLVVNEDDFREAMFGGKE